MFALLLVLIFTTLYYKVVKIRTRSKANFNPHHIYIGLGPITSSTLPKS